MIETTTVVDTLGYLNSLPPISYQSWGEFLARAGGTFILLLFFSLLLERGLVLLFEWEWFSILTDKAGMKPFIAFIVSGAICYRYGIDAVSMMFPPRGIDLFGVIMTAAVVCGGSKVVLTIMQKFVSGAKEIKQEIDEAKGASG